MKNVEDIYPLTPMQQSMLLHATVRPDFDTLHNQFAYSLQGELDSDAFRAAWMSVLQTHPALRTSFVWEGLPAAMQVVRQRVELRLDELDWRGQNAEQRSASRKAALAADRQSGFDLGQAPLMRLTLARESDAGWWLLWSSHHLVMDRWCTATVLEDLGRFYTEHRAGRGAAGRTGTARFGQYLQWIQAQDRERSESYWREALSGVDLAGRRVANGQGVEAAELSPSMSEACLDGAELRALRDTARACRVTPSVLAQAAWALVLHGRTNCPTVVYGATVSGRPPDLPNVERIVGSLVSNVPVRVDLDSELAVDEWLRQLQRAQQARQAHEYLATAEIQRCSGLPAAEPLFDSLFVWLAPLQWTSPQGLRMEPQGGSLETPWPVTVTAQDGSERLDLGVRSAQGGVDTAALLADWLLRIDQLSGAQGKRLGDLDGVQAAGDDPGAAHASNGHAPGLALRAPSSAGAGEGPAGREGEELQMVEDLLRAEVRSLLGHGSFTLDDSFFEIGGNSLLAAQLHVQIEGILARTVPILPMFQAGSLREMAAFLLRGDWPLRAGMVRPVRAHGSRTPLFCISSPEVNSIGYVLLARHLDPEQPVFLVQAPPSTDEVLRMAITEIPAFARRYFDALREAQPAGPYRLLGMCDGALIALEVAKLLRAEGEEVEYFGTLNSFSLNTLSQMNRVRRVEMRVRYYAERLSGLRAQPWSQRRQELGRVLRQRLPGGDRPSDQIQAPQAETPEPSELAGCSAEPQGPTAEVIHREWQDLDWPGKGPAIVPLDGKITVYRIRRQPYFRRRERALGWQRHARHVEVIDLVTEAQASPQRDPREWREAHLDILREPDVRMTAQAVQRSLDALEGERTANGDHHEPG